MSGRWDGACLYRSVPPAWDDLTPDDVRDLRRAARDTRGAEAGDAFVVAVGGRGRRADEEERPYVAALADAGADWWHEFLAPATPLAQVREHIECGPLRDAVGA